jgi:hypothetical protein
MGLVVGLSIGGDSGEDALVSSVEAGRADGPPVKTGGVLVLSFTMGAVMALGTFEDSLGRTVESKINVDGAELSTVVPRDCTSWVDSWVEWGKWLVTTGKAVVKSSEEVAAGLEVLDVVELSSVSMVLAGTRLSGGDAVLSGESTMVLALPTVDSVNPAPRDEAPMDDGDTVPPVVSLAAPLSWYGVDVVAFGWSTTAVKAGDSTTGVEI